MACIGEIRGAYRVLVGEPEGLRPVGRHMHRREDNIKMGFQEVVLGTWTGSFVVMTGTGVGLLCLYEPSASVKCRDFLASGGHVSFQRTVHHGAAWRMKHGLQSLCGILCCLEFVCRVRTECWYWIHNSSSWILCNYWLLPYLVALQLHTSWASLEGPWKIEKYIDGIAVHLKGDCCKNVWASVVCLWNRLVVWILFLRLWWRVQVSCVATVSDEYVASIVSRRGTSGLKMAATGSIVPMCRTARCHIAIS